MGEEVKRISVTFPVSVLEELRQYVPPRERSRFIVEATERALRQRRLAKVLEDLRWQRSSRTCAVSPRGPMRTTLT